MASSDDFRKQLKAGNITEALALALSEALELKITTWVASTEDEVQAEEAKPGERLRTRINLIEGDIDNEVGDRFLNTGPYRELRQLHLEQVAQGNKIIQSNLKSLQKLFEVLVALRYPNSSPRFVSPDLAGVESPLLPAIDTFPEAPFVESPASTSEELFESPSSAFDVPDTRLVEKPPNSAIDELFESPSSIVDVEVPDARLVEELPSSSIDESLVSPAPRTEADILEAQPVEAPPASTFDELVASPNSIVDADISETQLAEEPPSSSIEELFASPNSIVDTDIAEARVVEELPVHQSKSHL